MNKLPVIFALLFLSILTSMVNGEDLSQPYAERKLIIGTKHSPPFSIKGEDGTWSGISIELWTQIARELNLSYELQEMELKDLLDGVQNGRLDAAVAALTVTEEREKKFDFGHPFYTTGLGIAVVPRKGAGWIAFARRLFSSTFLKAVLVLAAVLLAVGVLAWLFERKKNAKQFDNNPVKGIGAGFWWSAVTMTTVGYGDKAPVTFAGRLLAIIWMFIAIITISSFTAAIAATLTVTQLEVPISGPEDLSKVRVAATTGSTSEAYLQHHRISYKSCGTIMQAMELLSDGQTDAVVYDAPILRYLVTTVRLFDL